MKVAGNDLRTWLGEKAQAHPRAGRFSAGLHPPDFHNRGDSRAHVIGKDLAMDHGRALNRAFRQKAESSPAEIFNLPAQNFFLACSNPPESDTPSFQPPANRVTPTRALFLPDSIHLWQQVSCPWKWDAIV